jgi:hypothetical protein
MTCKPSSRAFRPPDEANFVGTYYVYLSANESMANEAAVLLVSVDRMRYKVVPWTPRSNPRLEAKPDSPPPIGGWWR